MTGNQKATTTFHVFAFHCIPPPEPKPPVVLLPNTLPPVPVLAAPNGFVLLPNPICDRYRCQRTELELGLRRDTSISQEKNRNGHRSREVVTIIFEASGNVRREHPAPQHMEGEIRASRRRNEAKQPRTQEGENNNV